MNSEDFRLRGHSGNFAKSRFSAGRTGWPAPCASTGLFPFSLMRVESCCLLGGAPHKIGSEALSIWPMRQNPWAGTVPKLWPNRVKLLNFSFFASLLHFEEQPQLEQLGLNCRGECFHELHWLSQMSWGIWPLSAVPKHSHLIVPQWNEGAFISFLKSISCTIKSPRVTPPLLLFLARNCLRPGKYLEALTVYMTFRV